MLTAVLAAIALYLLAGIVGATRLVARGTFVYLASLAAGATILAHALYFLLIGDHISTATSFPLGLPWLSANLRIDALSAWFLLVVNLGASAASVYGLGYGPHCDEPDRVLPFFPAYLAAMNLVLLADDAFVFLLAWEVMSLTSWLLVLSNHRQPGNARAAFLYLVMAVLGTACLLLAFGIMSGFEGGYRFAEIRGIRPDGWMGGIALALVIVGAGSKAGLVPMHAWLPLAHPAAPSHVSALMSAVMTKVAIYGMVRILFDLAGPIGWGWGALLMGLGGLSAVMGILYALMQRDLKVLLAYSTVENIGVIAIGLGLALVFRANGLLPLAALALAASLFHMLNHALMKSLLFFVAGAVQVATATTDMERLGGLIHRLPRTAILALIGALAISALPPFNGFISEWLTFQAVLTAPSLPQWVLKFGVPVAGVLLALSAALAAACFVDAFGITFLGRPRGPEAAAAQEVEPTMVGVMAYLAGLCLLIGLLPTVVLIMLNPAVERLLGVPFPTIADGVSADEFLYLAPLGLGRSSYSGLIVLAVVTIVTIAVVLGVRRRVVRQPRRAATWDCGFPDPSPATQYTASSFAQPLRRVFGTLVFRAREHVDMPEPGQLRPAQFSLHLLDPAWQVFYAPVQALVATLADRMNVLQFLTIRRYLVFMFSALIVLLLAVAIAK